MITAQDIIERLKGEPLEVEGIDLWIHDYLFERFRIANSNTVEVSEIHVISRGWNKGAFVKSLERRGFIISYYCEDRPCGGCWYTITLPKKSI